MYRHTLTTRCSPPFLLSQSGTTIPVLPYNLRGDHVTPPRTAGCLSRGCLVLQRRHRCAPDRTVHRLFRTTSAFLNLKIRFEFTEQYRNGCELTHARSPNGVPHILGSGSFPVFDGLPYRTVNSNTTKNMDRISSLQPMREDSIPSVSATMIKRTYFDLYTSFRKN